MEPRKHYHSDLSSSGRQVSHSRCLTQTTPFSSPSQATKDLKRFQTAAHPVSFPSLDRRGDIQLTLSSHEQTSQGSRLLTLRAQLVPSRRWTRNAAFSSPSQAPERCHKSLDASSRSWRPSLPRRLTRNATSSSLSQATSHLRGQAHVRSTSIAGLYPKSSASAQPTSLMYFARRSWRVPALLPNLSCCPQD